MEKLATGMIRTSHGVRGHMKIRTFSGEHAHLEKLHEVTLKKGDREITCGLESVKPFHDGALIKLQGIDSPEAARSYSGWEIWVNREDAPQLEEGEYYFADLSGADLICSGEVVAKVVSVSSTAASELLEVVNDRGTFFIPFVDQFVGRVSAADKTIELKDRRLVE